MKLHEHQAKEILAQFNVPVPQGKVAYTVDEAVQAAESLGTPVAVKAQIHAGGRGKGGGIKLAKDMAQVKQYASDILGMTLVTPQTGPEGKEVKRVWIEKAAQIKHELYLAVLLDREVSRTMIMASREGGMDIEEVAAKTPEKIIKVWLDPGVGVQAYHARKLAYAMGLDQINAKLPIKLYQFLTKLYDAYNGADCALLEINPLIITEDDEIFPLDCKLQLEDNALYRHKNYQELRDESEEHPTEVEASSYGLNYINMDGNIGCMVNGAGLAMATMDIIKLHGGEPANFLDVGGGANKEQVAKAFKIIVSDEKVKAILVNIFGGIMKCDVIAQGIIDAVKELDLKVPLTVRLKGTNVDKGKQLLSDSGLNIIPAEDMGTAAKKAIASIS